jgi:hypothetical protein
MSNGRERSDKQWKLVSGLHVIAHEIVLGQVQILLEEVLLLARSSGVCEERVEEVVEGHVCTKGKVAGDRRGGERQGA